MTLLAATAPAPPRKANARTLRVSGETLLDAAAGHFEIRASPGAKPVKLPPLAIRQIFVEMPGTATPAALRLALRERIPLAFISMCGELIGHCQPPLAPSIGLRMAQYRSFSDGRTRHSLARRVVQSKLSACRKLLVNHGTRTARCPLRPAILALEAAHRDATRASTLDALRGVEGSAARAYFAACGKLFGEAFTFKARERRPPRDPANALLSYGYAVLVRDLAGQLEVAGLDPFAGWLHEPGYGSSALALDLAEPLRPLVVDSLAIRLSRAATSGDFEATPGGIRISRSLKAAFFEDYEARLRLRDRTTSGSPAGSLLAAIAESLVSAYRDNTLSRWNPLPESCLNHLS